MMKYTAIIILSICLAFICCAKKSDKDITESQVMKYHDTKPFYHYSPVKNWMNDPNGMVYYDGDYHLFYQYYPNGVNWGPMHWAHVTSTDLFHWKEKGIALYPDDLGMIFSGSAVVDSKNTSGFKNGNESPLVAIYTNADSRQKQSIAYSSDKGQTWTKYASNPVLLAPQGINDFRDPKVIWFASQNKWIMSLATGNKVSFYSSTDLKNWTFESDFGINQGYHGGVWECPDLFELTDEKGVHKWVLVVSVGGNETGEPNGGSSTQYFIGQFDGKSFTAENKEVLWADYGVDNYAGVTWSDIPAKDGRRIFMGWMSNWVYAGSTPTVGWRGETTVPREVKLVENSGKYTLYFTPANELNALKDAKLTSTVSTPQKSIGVINNDIVASGSYMVEMELDVSLTNDYEISMGNELEKLTIAYNKTNSEFVIDRSNSGIVDFNPMFKRNIACKYSPQTTRISLQLLVDKSSVELFINKGEKVMTALFYPKYVYRYFKVQSNSTNEFIKNYSITALNKSIAQ